MGRLSATVNLRHVVLAVYLETVHALAFLHPATSGHEGVRFVFSVWGSSCICMRSGRRVGFVDKCWRVSLRSLLACATIWGFRPPFFLSACRGEENLRGHGTRPLFLIGWCVGARSGGAAVCRVGGCFEVIMLRCGGHARAACPNGLSKRFPCRVSLGWWHVFFGFWLVLHEKTPWWGCSPGGLLIT